MTQSPGATTYWPGVEWRPAMSESQGLDSQALATAIAQVREKEAPCFTARTLSLPRL
jgi:hypothetical protein